MGSVPGSLAASSRSVQAGRAALLGPLRPVGPTPEPFSWTKSPKGGLHSRCTCVGWGTLGPQPAQVQGSIRSSPRLGGQLPAEASLGTLPTGHGELKLESGEWEAADTAILCSLFIRSGFTLLLH